MRKGDMVLQIESFTEPQCLIKSKSEQRGEVEDLFEYFFSWDCINAISSSTNVS